MLFKGVHSLERRFHAFEKGFTFFLKGGSHF